MDKFEKAFEKLSAKEQKQLEEILAQLEAGLFKNLDIKKLKGANNIFRNGKIFLIKLSRRSEKTYRNL